MKRLLMLAALAALTAGVIVLPSCERPQPECSDLTLDCSILG